MSDITWQEFFDMVLLEANKGDTLKDVIPGKVFRLSAHWNRTGVISGMKNS